MRAGSACIHDAMERGDIELTTLERVYLADEVFLTDRALNFWRKAEEQAGAEGFTGVRAVVQLDRQLRCPKTLGRWMEYENYLTRELEARGNTMLCLYSRSAQPAPFVLDALLAHPIVAHRGAICDNTCHVPPDEYKASDRAKRAADRVLAGSRRQCLRDNASSWDSLQRRNSLDQRLSELLSSVETSAGAMQTLAAESNRKKRDEYYLRMSVEYLAASQRITHTGSWAWNPLSRQLFWSGEHFRIFGLDPACKRITYRDFLKMVHPQERSHVAREFEAAVSSRRDFDAEYRIVRADGSVRHIHSRASALCGEYPEVTEYVGTVVDITDQALRQKGSRGRTMSGIAKESHGTMVRQLMGVIAHEVNQPLTALVTNAAAALRWMAAVPATRQDTASIAANR